MSSDFAEPTELACAVDVDATLKRAIPMLAIAAFVSWLVVAVALGLAFPNIGVVSFVGALVAGVTVPALIYLRKRTQLSYQYGSQQRLVLSPTGLRKSDNAIVIEMPWTGISHIETRNSSLPGGWILKTGPLNAAANAAITQAHNVIAEAIVGSGTLMPISGAPRGLLKAHDRLYGSRLREGQVYNTSQALIFPGEFEHDWAHGIVGGWLSHYRPDVTIPSATTKPNL